MSDETNVNVTMEEERPKKRGVRKRLRSWLGEKIAGESATERMAETWSRIHRVGGFTPIFVEGRLELRTLKQESTLNEIQKEMEKCKTPLDFKKTMFDANLKTYALFQVTGSQFMRGGKDKSDRFGSKVMAYLELFQRSWNDNSYGSLMDLFTCSMAMLHFSWKPEDVGSVPPYLIETKTVVQPTQQQRLAMEDAQVS